MFVFFFSSRRRHTRSLCDWSSDVCSSDLAPRARPRRGGGAADRERGGGGRDVREPGRARATLLPGEARAGNGARSEERRVGKECRYRWWPDHKKKKQDRMQNEASRTHRST